MAMQQNSHCCVVRLLAYVITISGKWLKNSVSLKVVSFVRQRRWSYLVLTMYVRWKIVFHKIKKIQITRLLTVQWLKNEYIR